MTIEQAIQLAYQHHQAGRLAEAEKIYRQVLAQQPNQPDTLHLLGMIAYEAGRHAAAAELIGRAVALSPQRPDFRGSLGLALAGAGNMEAAIAEYRRAIELKPDLAQAHNNLGLSLAVLGRIDEAIDSYQRAAQLAPALADAPYNLANAYKDMGRLDEAIAQYARAVALRPKWAKAHSNLGVALKLKQLPDRAAESFSRAAALEPNDAPAWNNLGETLCELRRFEQAAAACRRALALAPNLPEAHNNLGLALCGLGTYDEAIRSFRAALALRPDYADAHGNLGNALKDTGQLDEAIASFRRAIRFKPDLAAAHNNLGIALQDTEQFDEAIASLRQALRFKPDLAEACTNLGNAFSKLGQVDEAISAYRQAVQIKPDDAAAHGNILFASHSLPAFDPRSLLVESRQWNRQHAEPLRHLIRPHANDRNPDRRLRIGYVSPDLRNHPVSRFVLPLLAAHHHDASEIFAYAQVLVPDKITAKLKASCDTWRSIVNFSDERVAEMIREDRIDILIDLAGHTSNNRLLVFAQKPAPVQITWLGYPGTTGLSAMDYRFTDALADPPGVADGFCTERLIRLPQTAWCFQPPDDSPSVNELPAAVNQRVTFGNFNNFAKLNDPMLKLWAKILHQTPGSKLLLKAKSLGSESVRRRVRQKMSEAGCAPDRLELLGWVASAAHLAQYGQVDIALDTYPYHGTTTTCEALWMGVPVVTLAGESHVSRVGVSLLSNIGLPDLIAQNSEQYVRIAADLAANLSRPADLRRTLRPRMEASVLMDGPRFARDVEAAYRGVWREWCAHQ